MESRKKSRKTTRWLFWGFGILFVLLVLGATYGYKKIQPSQHFKKVETLAEPARTIQEKDIPPNPSKPSENRKPTSEKAIEPFNVLLLGLDGEHSKATRTDVIMVANINPEKKTVNLLSIPRDTQVHLQGIGLTKINHAHFMAELSGESRDGTEASIQAVADLLGIPIHYYVKTDFNGFVKFIDDIGGLEIDLPYSVQINDDVVLKKGHQEFNGEVALAFARERYHLQNGDFGRQESQMLILQSMAQKLLQPSNISRLPSLYSRIKRDIVDTNFTQMDILSLAFIYKGMSGEQLHYFQVPGHSDIAQDPILRRKLYYWIPNMEEVKEIIHNW
ncbi:LCP family protein [Bacillus sp. CGMCC 1.16607]|uniref:LCP family glycopolymer transferase n=1 Tax=Bacillus sp. CGMCC 1.16607 TaxID=3351842 RepID=UPI003641F8EA